MVTNQQTAILTTTGAQLEMGCSKGPARGRYHSWQIHNNSTSSAVVRPQGSLAEDHDQVIDPDDFWTDLGSANTTIAAGATALIEIPDSPLARVRLNVVTLADNNIHVKQASHE